MGTGISRASSFQEPDDKSIIQEQLYEAIENRRTIHEISELLTQGADPTADGAKALCLAIFEHKIQTDEELDAYSGSLIMKFFEKSKDDFIQQLKKLKHPSQHSSDLLNVLYILVGKIKLQKLINAKYSCLSQRALPFILTIIEGEGYAVLKSFFDPSGKYYLPEMAELVNRAHRQSHKHTFFMWLEQDSSSRLQGLEKSQAQSSITKDFFGSRFFETHLIKEAVDMAGDAFDFPKPTR